MLRPGSLPQRRVTPKQVKKKHGLELNPILVLEKLKALQKGQISYFMDKRATPADSDAPRVTAITEEETGSEKFEPR